MTAPARAAAVLVLAGAGALAAWLLWPKPAPPAPPPEPIPREPEAPAFESPFRNTRPGVKYVGDAACEKCHAQIARTYRQHPMGRSAEWVRGSAFDHAAGAHASFTASGFALKVARDGDRVRHCFTPEGGGPEYAPPADLAIGSGERGRSYLSVERGAVWQSPISWFGHEARWNVSPGFDLAKQVRRPIVPRCLECHTDLPVSVPDALNRFAEPLLPVQAHIGCERCHGPGELHVVERAQLKDGAGTDTSIVNPARLSAELRADVCRQCHLQGAVQIERRGRAALEYRPGLPWEQFVSTFLRHPDVTDPLKSVGQFEQTESSRCFTASAGKLHCATCHDPHAKPAPGEAAAHFRARCLTCHSTKGCALPEPTRAARANDCAACHMPKLPSTNVAHVAVTDHRIMRRPDAGGAKAKLLPAGAVPLVPYRAGPHAPPVAERERDFAIVLANEFARTGTSLDRWRACFALLDVSLNRWPDDGAALLARSRALARHRDGAGAVAAARAALAHAPQSEVALIQLAGAALAADDHETSLGAATKLIELNPTSVDHRMARASARLARNDWPGIEADTRAALALEPTRGSARFLLAAALHKRGDAAGAKREFEVVLKVTPDPATRAKLVEWYADVTK